MKLQSKNSKSRKIVITVGVVLAVVLLIAGVAVLLISNSNSNDEISVERISLSSYPDRIQYYIGEEFDPKGTKIQVFTTDPNTTYFVDYDELVFTGFESSTAVDSQTITVSYQGCTTTFNVVISEYPTEAPTLVSIDVPNIITTYSLEEWNKYGPILSNLTILLTYSDGTTREIPLEPSKHVERPAKPDTPGTTELIVKHSEGSVTIVHKITITLT